MFSLRMCTAAFRAGISGLRSSIPPNVVDVGPKSGVITTACTPLRNFSAIPSCNANAKVTQGPGRLISTLPALTFRNTTSLLHGCNSVLVSSSRSIMKIFWQRPKETKRIKTHGWKARMSTPAGRRIIMKRILRGRHILTH